MNMEHKKSLENVYSGIYTQVDPGARCCMVDLIKTVMMK
jgi:hypothetical protein